MHDAKQCQAKAAAVLHFDVCMMCEQENRPKERDMQSHKPRSRERIAQVAQYIEQAPFRLCHCVELMCKQ